MPKADVKKSHSGQPVSVYLFYGDEFLVKEAVQGLIARTLDPELRNTNLILLDGGSLRVGDLASHVLTPSLFPGPRVILVEQSPVFMGKVDRGKILDNLLTAWAQERHEAALTGFGQLLALSGMESAALTGEPEWVNELAGDKVDSAQRTSLQQVAQAFVDSGRRVEISTDEAAVEELLGNRFPEGTVLVFTAAAVDRRKKLVKAVEKLGQVVECAVSRDRRGVGMERAFFEQRVREQIEKAHKKIGHGALEAMYARCGKDMRQLHSELEKLVAYVGSRSEVTGADVEAVFTDFHESVYYELTGALRAGDLPRSLVALRENLSSGAHPLAVLAAISNEFRRLTVARELLFTVFRGYWKPGMRYERFVQVLGEMRDEQPSKKSKEKLDLLALKEYPLYLYMRDAQKFPMDKLIKIMEAILEADVNLKSSRLSRTAPGTILEKLLFQICPPSRT
jgi:DNA polymerase-3 subunit delta